MIIVWSGRGYLIPIIVATSGTLFAATINGTLGDGYCGAHHWPVGASLIVSAVVCRFLGKYLTSRPAPMRITQPTGKEIIVMGTKDRLFFIPVHFWGPILAAIGSLLCLVDFVL